MADCPQAEVTARVEQQAQAFQAAAAVAASVQQIGSIVASATLPQTGWITSGSAMELGIWSDAQAMATRQLEALLRRAGRRLVETPKDGSCLFHALNLSSRGAPVMTIDEMRSVAVAQATPEQLEVAAMDRGLTVEEYRSLMMRRTTWGDELMVAMMAITLVMSITVVSPVYTRTWDSNGTEREGASESAVWIAYNGSNHYYGTALLDQHG